jgi:hypothetical protein
MSGFPSSFRSATVTLYGLCPDGKPMAGANDAVSNAPVEANVGVKESPDSAMSPATVTLIGAYVAPAGTSMVSDVAVADCTAALTAPNSTRVAPAAGAKPVPVMTTLDPIPPAIGLKPDTDGT